MNGVKLKYYGFESLLSGADWLTPAYVGVDEKGIIKYLSSQPDNGIAVEFVNGYVLPGFQNAHSHAFQYSMAGMNENFSSPSGENFWSWRDEMYKWALAINPDELRSIATMLYAEMLRFGYTQVAEFHYLHHDKDGKPYQHLGEMASQLLEAANTAGIKITLLPVFYQKGGLGREPEAGQRRFISKSRDDYFKLLEESKSLVANYQNAQLGFSVHSIRAVNLDDIVKTFEEGPKTLPFHVHLAEQKAEVVDCLAYCNQRPLAWFIDHLPVNERFNFVHATHLDDYELNKIVETKSNVILCPSTEGNLGDGFFRMKEFSRSQGRWSIGTDSHVCLDPLEEFRMIDYRQRLITNERNTFEGDGAKYLINTALKNGRKAMGAEAKNNFSIGQSFDAVVYESPLLHPQILESKKTATLVYAPSTRRVGTIVDGKWVVKDNHHFTASMLKENFAQAIKKIVF